MALDGSPFDADLGVIFESRPTVGGFEGLSMMVFCGNLLSSHCENPHEDMSEVYT